MGGILLLKLTQSLLFMSMHFILIIETLATIHTHKRK